MQIYGLIPARLESTRLKEKLLLPIGEVPMIVKVAQQALKCAELTAVYVCTDSDRIIEVCTNYGISTVKTGSHLNGTDRIAEAAELLNLPEDCVIVDIQGDEPMLDPDVISRLIHNTKRLNTDIVMPYQLLEYDDINRVKVVEELNKLLYLTRSSCPSNFRGSIPLKKQLCIISFTRSALRRFYTHTVTTLELVEGVELLRALVAGINIGTYQEISDSISVDVQDDYIKVLEWFNNGYT